MADTSVNGDRLVADASMDIDMDIDLGPEPELDPGVELIQAVSLPATLRLSSAVDTDASLLSYRIQLHKPSLLTNLPKRQSTRKSTCAAWMR
jgi:hypothetical protein